MQREFLLVALDLVLPQVEGLFLGVEHADIDPVG